MSDVLLHPIPRFVVSRFVPRPPMPCYPGLVGVRVRGRLVSPPEVGDRRWPVWCEHGFMQWGVALENRFRFHPGDVHFSHDQCHPPPLSYIPLLCEMV